GYHRLCISCNQFVQPVTQLFNPMSKSHKKNVFPLLSLTYDPEEFKLHRRERQHKYRGLRNDEKYGEESMSLSYVNYKAEKWHPSEMEGHFGSSFLHKCLNASKDHLWMRSTDQICADLVGRRCFLKLSSICFVTFLTVCANPASAKIDEKFFYDEKRLLEQNKRIQKANGAPPGFPNFIREGFDVKVVTSDNYVRCDSGLIYWDIREGEGDYPKTGQQVIFNYQGYNESGRRIDSSYQQGEPAKTRVGINGLVPGVEEGIRTMKPGGKRRIIVPPELGPP
ncbi:hypothetical protein KI387_036449, partial [Taxus chinensis]